MGIFDKLLKRNKKEEKEIKNVGEIEAVEKNTTSENINPYCLLRTLSLSGIQYFDKKEFSDPDVGFEVTNARISFKTLLKHIDATPVVIYYNDLQHNRSKLTAGIMEKYLQENHITVLGVYKNQDLAVVHKEKLSHEYLRNIAKEVFNNEFIIFITKEENIIQYMSNVHPHRANTHVLPGTGVMSNGDYF